MKNATLRQLKVFEAAARQLSFSRAAQELHLTQPAVSTQIKLLQQHAGVRLAKGFIRGARAVEAALQRRGGQRGIESGARLAGGNGQLVAWLRRNNPNILVFLPADEPERSQAAAGLAHFLCERGQERMLGARHQGVLITTINGQPVAAHFMARPLMDAGFYTGPLGMHLRRIPLPVAHHDSFSGHANSGGEVQ